MQGTTERAGRGMRRRRAGPAGLGLRLVGLLLVGLVGLGLASGPARAAERLLEFRQGRAVGEFTVAKGQFLTARTAADVARVVVGNPDIATAVPLGARSFYILGRGEGRTNVAVYGAGEEMLGQVAVEVGADVPDLSETLREIVPQARVKADTVNGRLRLSGTVPDAIALRKVLEVAEQYGTEGVINALRVTGGQQVMLEVRFVEVNRNAGRDLGISWHGRGRRGDGRTGGFRPRGEDEIEDGVVRFTPTLLGGGTPFGTLIGQVLGGGVSADILVQALEEKGLARRLAEPNLIALSGEKASFLAGGEVPVPVASEENRITVQYKEYGVRLSFVPVVLDNGLINLRLEPEVSQVDESIRVSTGAISIPSFITRRASTAIEVRDGQSFAMAGLLQSVHSKSQEQLPWLGQLPVIGALFRSSAFQEQETDLVIIVTPRLVQPARPGRGLRTPLDGARPSNDAEFFLLGQLEVDRRAASAGVRGPYGHVVELPGGAGAVKQEKRHEPKAIVRK